MESAVRLMLGIISCFLSAEVLRLSAKSDSLLDNCLLIVFLFISYLLKPILMEESLF